MSPNPVRVTDFGPRKISDFLDGNQLLVAQIYGRESAGGDIPRYLAVADTQSRRGLVERQKAWNYSNHGLIVHTNLQIVTTSLLIQAVRYVLLD